MKKIKTPFSNFIKAPDNLKKRLDFIGLIKNKSNIYQLQSNFKDGQILVSLKMEKYGDGMGMCLKENKVHQQKQYWNNLKNRRLKQLSKKKNNGWK